MSARAGLRNITRDVTPAGTGQRGPCRRRADRPDTRSARRRNRGSWAKTGYFAYDTMTLIGPGTWEAARAAVDVALTAVDLVAAGAPFGYTCCRPPGHHVCRACYGGSCYLNNSAVVAA